tara:strand:+ start:3064 stop:4131 length:1068 start_codon:yes stop_codon:yes gene_type:complete
MKLDNKKLGKFLQSIKNNKSGSLDIDNLSQPSAGASMAEINNLKNNVEDIKKKVNILLSSKESHEALKVNHINKALNYLKERMDLIIDHKKIKGEISSIEIKELKVNVLKDKINYLEKKLNSVLHEREKRFALDKEAQILKKERLSVLTNKISDMETKLQNMVDLSKPQNEKTILRIEEKIKELKKKSETMFSHKSKDKEDLEFKVISQISNMLEEKKQELQELENELLLEKGIVEPEKETEKINVDEEESKKEVKQSSGNIGQQEHITHPMEPDQIPVPHGKTEKKLHKYDFELPEMSTKHDFDLDLPDPVPLQEYQEKPFQHQVPEKPKKKQGFFAKLLGMFKKKKKKSKKKK